MLYFFPGSFLVPPSTEDVQSLILKGRAEFYSQNYTKALQNFEGALQLDPGNLEAVLGRMDARAYLKQRSAAFSQAEGVFKDRAREAGSVAVHILMWRRKAADAEKLLQTLLGKNPDFYHYHYQMGLIQLQRKKIKPAIASFTKAIELKPSFSCAYYKLGDADRISGDVAGVVSAWNKYAEMVPRYGTRYEYVVKYLKGMSGR
jgi:tetratricopeptide (TPR) repeat protein